MFNELWGVLFICVNFALFLICFRWFGRPGMYAWVAMATVIANIQVIKTIEVLGIVMTLGNTIYATISMSMDLLNEKYGPQAAKKAVWIGFFSLIAATVMMQMVLVFVPQEGDLAQEALESIFAWMPRIAAASLAAYFISQFLDVRLFQALRGKFPERRQLWIRAAGSTMLSQLVDSFVFCVIAFAGAYPPGIWLQILITTYLFKFVIAMAGTPVLYIARRFEHSE